MILNIFICFEHCSQFCTLFTILNIIDVPANRFLCPRVGRIFQHEIGTGVSLKEKCDIIIKLKFKRQHKKHTHTQVRNIFTIVKSIEMLAT